MTSGGDESYPRLLSAVEHERTKRGLNEEPERGADLHALAWSRIAQALEGGRKPSVDDLLSGIAGDPSIPEIVRNYAADLIRGETKPTAGPKPEWNLNHRAWQFTRDLLLVERVHGHRRKMPNGDATPPREVFIYIEVRKWLPVKFWGELAERASAKPWNSETIEKRYYEAMKRLEKASRERRLLDAERLRLSAK